LLDCEENRCVEDAFFLGHGYFLILKQELEFQFPLLEERARERGGWLESSVTSTPHPNPPLKGEGVSITLISS
jgi:hypothetical protein